MKVLIIGSGGREHALAECFARSSKVREIIVAPGNAGIALQFRCEPLVTHSEIIDYCLAENIDLVFIGPEQPIAEGLSDALGELGLKVIAPSRFAAQLETSKIFAKQLMQKKGIPTARYRVIKTQKDTEEVLNSFDFPLVLKADGLAGGKGVIIAHDRQQAIRALEKLNLLWQPQDCHSDKCDNQEIATPINMQGVIGEEFLSGWEVSLFAISDGWNYQSTIFAQDHKQLYDNDMGPNTGGMGAYAPVIKAESYKQQIEDEIITPVLAAMCELGHPYKGILYCGLMITAQGPRVIEFNCRWGDPEAQVLLPLLETDFVDICSAILTGRMNEVQVKFSKKTALGVVLASGGYPGDYKKGYPIAIENVGFDTPLNGDCKTRIYYSGVAISETDEGEKQESPAPVLITDGGRVLCMAGLGDTLQDARQICYSQVDKINFSGKTYRKDIGLRLNEL